MISETEHTAGENILAEHIERAESVLNLGDSNENNNAENGFVLLHEDNSIHGPTAETASDQSNTHRQL